MTLPSELNSLIKERSGFAILIKGPAGVGKTLLTLEMLLSAPRGLYMSTRVSPQALVDQVSGFEQHSEKIKVIDASQFGGSGINHDLFLSNDQVREQVRRAIQESERSGVAIRAGQMVIGSP